MSETISRRDRQALEYLSDIRYNRGARGMLIEFHFLENPFFENKVSYNITQAFPDGHMRLHL